MPVSAALKHYLSHLSVAERIPCPDNEEWEALINRISRPGTIAAIDQDTFWYFLEVLPPKYQSGSLSAFAEGAEELRLFWRDGDQYFCRQLTWDETRQFCRLAEIPLPC